MALAAAPDIPGFHALSQLGAGPSSWIYSAQSEGLGRWVALTIYSSSGSADSSDPGADGFRKGFELTRRLGAHPHAVTLLDWGISPDERPYIVTEVYEHGTFETRVSGDQPLPVDKTLRIGIQVAGALETAHRAGVIHGGVHPARILADSDDEPSLADIGLVTLVDPSGPDALLGPPNHHAPPEVLEGDTVSAATDVYSLASTLHTLLTCRPPYRTKADDTAAALLLRVLRHEHTPLTRTDAPPALVQALHAALHPDPGQRPASVLTFAQSLQAVQNEIGAPQTHPVLLDVAQQLSGADEPAAPPWARSGAIPAPRPPVGPTTAPTPVVKAPGPQRQGSAQPPRPPMAAPSETPPSAPTPIDKAFVPYTADPSPPLSPPAPETAPPPAVSDQTQPPAPSSPMPGPAGLPRSDSTVPDRRTRLVARGPKALPVVILGAIVAALIAGATWMVLSGSDPSDATTNNDPTEQPSDD